MRERPNRMVSKTIVAQVTVGSNPTPSAPTEVDCSHSTHEMGVETRPDVMVVGPRARFEELRACHSNSSGSRGSGSWSAWVASGTALERGYSGSLGLPTFWVGQSAV